jgi:uncharacterized protein (TIGR00645 family)
LNAIKKLGAASDIYSGSLSYVSIRFGHEGEIMVAKEHESSLHKIFTAIEHSFEAAIFASRWLLAPAYVLLVATLAVLSYKTVEEFIQLVLNLRLFDESHAILQALTIVDLVLVLNLILMVILVGYVNFVSKIHPKKEEDWPEWMTLLDYSGLKVQLLGSIIAIASVKILRSFIQLSDSQHVDREQILLMSLLYVLFLVAVMCIAIVNKIKPPSHGKSDHGK